MALNNEAYLVLGFGRQYIRDAKDLIDTLRHFKDNRPVNIVVSPQDIDYAKNLDIFDSVIDFDVTTHQLFNLCRTNFEKFCLLPRLELYKFLVTEYTMVLDTDILCSYFTDDIWHLLKNKNQDLVMLGSKYNPVWHWGHWQSICNKIGIKEQETHGGLFFLRNTKSLEKIFLDAKYCFLNYDQLNMLRYYQGGAVDEPCFSYSFSKNNLTPVEFSELPIMTFNLQHNDVIPTKYMTEERQKKEMNQYIPFIHMFEKNNSLNFQLLKQKILRHES